MDEPKVKEHVEFHLEYAEKFLNHIKELNKEGILLADRYMSELLRNPAYKK